MTSMAGQNSGYYKEKIPKGYNKTKIQKYTPEATQQYQDLYGQVDKNSYTARLANGDQSMFEEIEAPAMRQFQALQGDVSSRFSGMGMGARRGSGFQNEMNQQTSNFAQDLQSKRSEMRRNAISDLMGMSKDLMDRNPYEVSMQKKEPSWWQKALGGGSGIVGGAAGAFFGGPAGAKMGYDAGNQFGQAFQ